MAISMQTTWVKVSAIVLAVVAGLLILALIALMIWSFKQERSEQNKLFLSGTVPTSKLDGSYKGNLQGASSWQGKKFDAKTNSGINVFGDGERYRFATSNTKALGGDQQVLKLDYNQAGNPIWLRQVVDEAVEVGPGHYQGKVYLRIWPFTFTITFFELQK